MKLLLDTNILLDFADAKRAKEFPASVEVVAMLPEQGHAFFLTHATLATLDYMTGGAPRLFRELLRQGEVAPLSTADARLALQWGWDDFEDAMQAAAAQSAKCDYIVTRNVDDFSRSPVPAISPSDFLLFP